LLFALTLLPPPRSPLFPYTTLFRSPKFARGRPGDARASTRAMLPAAAGLNALAAVPLALAAGVVLPLVYGHAFRGAVVPAWILRSEEHTSELQSRGHLVCRLLLEKK